jgi:hypothetical protein
MLLVMNTNTCYFDKRYGNLVCQAVEHFEDQPTKPKFLCVIGSFKNQVHMMKEWIEHHLWQGVDHFYLFDEGSYDDYWTIIESYVRRNIVTIEVMPSDITDVVMMRNSLYKKYREHSTWFAVIDVGTFLFPTKYNTVRELLDYEYTQAIPAAGIYTHAHVFNTSNNVFCVRKESYARVLNPESVPTGIVYSTYTRSLQKNSHEHEYGQVVFSEYLRANKYALHFDALTRVEDTKLKNVVEEKYPNQRCW